MCTTACIIINVFYEIVHPHLPTIMSFQSTFKCRTGTNTLTFLHFQTTHCKTLHNGNTLNPLLCLYGSTSHLHSPGMHHTFYRFELRMKLSQPTVDSNVLCQFIILIIVVILHPQLSSREEDWLPASLWRKDMVTIKLLLHSKEH